MTNLFFAESTPTHLEQVPGRPMRPAAMFAVLMASLSFRRPGCGSRDPRRGDSAGAGRKQKALAPPQPNAAERTIDRLEEWGFISGSPRGVYPWMGSIYPGGGVAAGAGVRKEFGDDGALNVFAGYSIRSYTIGQADLALPTFAKSRAHADAVGQYIDAPDVKYYGVGNDSSKDGLTYFGYTPTRGGTRFDFDISKNFTAGGDLAISTWGRRRAAPRPRPRRSTDPRTRLASSCRQFSFINSTARASFDWRRRLGYSGSGGVYRAQFDDYRDRDHGRYSFRSFEAEALQLIPVLRANWVDHAARCRHHHGRR